MFEKHGIEAEFERLLVLPHELPLIRGAASRLSGFAVTMPHKRAVIPFLDSVSETASRCGAVNIVEKRGSRLIGHNTDGEGLADALEAEGIGLSGKRAFILGRGGAALSAYHALKSRGASAFLVVRSPEEPSGTERYTVAEALSRAPKADVFINATPLGMKGAGEFDRFDLLDALSPSVVFDMVYRRGEKTLLAAESARRGIITLEGESMLLFQAKRAFKIWFGVDA